MLSVILAAVVAATAPAPSAPAREADPKVCHVEPIQGSRITHRVCLRASEAALLRRDARLLLDHAQRGAQAPNMANIVAMGPLR
ncbi:MAG: hypothetical protein ACJ798_01995 [Phenylobacterium sp.]